LSELLGIDASTFRRFGQFGQKSRLALLGLRAFKGFPKPQGFSRHKKMPIFWAVGFGLDGIASSGVVTLRRPQV
jgi:hypothetical protein